MENACDTTTRGVLVPGYGLRTAHPQLDHLGPEPLTEAFNGKRLFDLSRQRKIAVKPFIMDNKTVVGVGNIYASEALFRSGIRPDRERRQNLSAAL